jgi:hypothetical protein
MSRWRPWPGTTAALLCAGSILAQVSVPPTPVAVPLAATLAAPQARAFEQLADELLAANHGDLALTQQRLFDRAAAARDDTTRYLLLDQARSLAERQHCPALAIAALDQIASRFDSPVPDAALLLLPRMLADGATPAAAVAIAAGRQAVAGAQRTDDRLLRSLYELAVRAAAAEGDPWLQAKVAGDRARLQELHDAFCRWSGGNASPREGRRQLFATLFLSTGRLGAPTLGELAGEVSDHFEADQVAQRLGELKPERLLAMSQHASSTWVRRSLQRAAHARLGNLIGAADSDVEREVMARQMSGISSLLADQDGITRLRFRTEADRQQVVTAGDHWRIEDGLLVGTATETANATHRYAFENVRSVVIAGGIRSAAGLNFRIAVGNVNLLCNWEGAPENHAYFGSVRQTLRPPALTAGKLHTIALHRTDTGIVVCIDDRPWCTGIGTLDGTVSVYPALGSEIFVREILVDGDLEVAGSVSFPRSDLR